MISRLILTKQPHHRKIVSTVNTTPTTSSSTKRLFLTKTITKEAAGTTNNAPSHRLVHHLGQQQKQKNLHKFSFHNYNRNNLFIFGSGILLGSALCTNFIISQKQPQKDDEASPSFPFLPLASTCEESKEGRREMETLTPEQLALPDKLRRIVGDDHVVDGTTLGCGSALCIVTPDRLKHVMDCLDLIIHADCVIIPQGQSTSLSGGTVPRNSEGKRRPVVIFSMKNLNDIVPIDRGNRVLCLAGAGLSDLEQFCKTHFPHRESHSTLGSTFLNPTIAAGVAFGSGGSQCRKGPAYTDRALYVKYEQNKWKEFKPVVVNTLGIENMTNTERKAGAVYSVFDTTIRKLDQYVNYQRGKFGIKMLKTDLLSPYSRAKAHQSDYAEKLCDHQDNKDCSRYNADTTGEDCNRSEGKVLILATIHDTFPVPVRSQTYWIGFKSLELALEFRKEVCLHSPKDMPISVEYMDRDSYDVIDRSGRVLSNIIKLVGVSSPFVRTLWNAKLYIEGLPFESAPLWIDKLLHKVNPIFPSVLPNNVTETGKTMDHHVVMTIADVNEDSNDIGSLLERLSKFEQKHNNQEAKKVAIHRCDSSKASLSAFRFVAPTSFRTYCVGENAHGISVDYVLPKTGGKAPSLTSEEGKTSSSAALKPLKRMRYSHFACNVVYEDIAYSSTDPTTGRFISESEVHDAKMELKRSVESPTNGGKVPAQRGHGTEYHAPKETLKRWMKMDPLNVMNPGVGGLSHLFKYGNGK